MRRLWLVLGWLWALPTTALGLVLAILGGALPYRLRPAGVLQFHAAGGLWLWWMERYGMAAITIGAVAIFRAEWCDDAVTIRHERQHTYQAMCLGAAFIPVYYLLCLWALCLGRDAYRYNPLEVAAYARQEDTES